MPQTRCCGFRFTSIVTFLSGGCYCSSLRPTRSKLVRISCLVLPCRRVRTHGTPCVALPSFIGRTGHGILTDRRQQAVQLFSVPRDVFEPLLLVFGQRHGDYCATVRRQALVLSRRLLRGRGERLRSLSVTWRRGKYRNESENRLNFCW